MKLERMLIKMRMLIKNSDMYLDTQWKINFKKWDFLHTLPKQAAGQI